MGRIGFSILVSLVAIAASGAANSQAPARSYAALSMIGNSITVVGQNNNVGSRLSQQRPETVAVAPRFMDGTALQAIRTAILAVDPKASVALYAASSAALERDPRDLFDGNKLKLAEQMIAAMREDKATRLILVTRYRSDEPIRGTSGRGYEAGSLEGLGIYANAEYRFHAPYVYLRVSIVDLDTLTVEREKLITSNYVLSTRTGINDGRQLPALVDLLRHEVSAALAPLLM